MVYDPVSAYPGTVKATIPAHSGFCRIEFVVESGGYWYKASVPETAWASSNGPSNGPRYLDYTYASADIESTYNWNLVTFVIDKPFVIVDYPRDSERITYPSYTLKMVPSGSTNNVNISIDNGPWLGARKESDGYWYYDWSGYSPGTHYY
jgi:hypothetical protein